MPISDFDRPLSYILVWPGDEPELVPGWNGVPVLLPAREDIAIACDERDKRTWGSKFRFPSAMDRQGKPIPGTILLQDRIMDDPLNGGSRSELDAKEWCKGVKENNKPLFARGFRIVMDPEEVPIAMEEGRPLWERAQEAAWEQEVRDEYARQKNFEQKNGTPAPQSSSHDAVKKAIAGLAKIRREKKDPISKDDLLAVLGPSAQATVTAKPAPPPSEEDEYEDPEVRKAALEMRNIAKRKGVYLKKEELEGLLDLDADVMKAVEEKLQEAGALA